MAVRNLDKLAVRQPFQSSHDTLEVPQTNKQERQAMRPSQLTYYPISCERRPSRVGPGTSG